MRTELLLAAALLLGTPGVGHARLRVAASTNDLASIAASVGGEQIEAFAIARPNNDVHRVEVLPSYMVKVSKADLYLKVGLGLDAWADAIIAGSRNQRVRIVDCSKGIDPLERPTDKVTAAMGDVHPNGNPHYWLDPRNGAQVARTIAEALGQADPAHAGDYHERAEALAKECEAARERGRRLAAGLPVREIVTYHRSWPYLAAAFGLTIAATVEPVPGIPPTARHLAELLAIIRSRRIPVLLQEPYFSGDAGKFLARESGLRVVVASASCEKPEAGSYLAHLADVLQQIGEAEAATP